MAVVLREAILNLEPANWTRFPTREEHMTGEATADTATTTETTTTETTVTAEPSVEELQAEVEKWKTQSRKHEDRAKQNATAAKELEEAKRQGMTELEAAADKARSEGHAQALAELGAKLVNAEIRVAAKGRVEDVDALIEGIDGAKFLDADGEPDRDAIAAWVERIAPERDGTSLAFPDLGQGARTNGTDKSMSGDPLVQALTAKVGKR